jgi:hypothetical protein
MLTTSKVERVSEENGGKKEEKEEKDKSADKSKDNEEVAEESLMFQLLLENPSPAGVTIASQNICHIEIVACDDKVDEQQ